VPSLNLSIQSSAHDGHASWANRGNANGTSFNTALQNSVGTHLDTNLILSRFFIFRFGNGTTNSGLPQGALINSAKLNLRFNNGVISSILHNHVYLCVENNLDPTGTGAIVNGTLGSQAYQRLGRQTAATTLFGARCGPTHTGDLASVGRGVRESQALIYKAFADSRDLPTGTWQLTDDFSGALQALVDDPSWNPDSQYVMVHMFADDRISSGSTGGVGYLGGITWASGQTGSTGEGNGPSGAQIFFYDQSFGTYSPQLQIDYTNTSLKAISSGSVSSGSVRFQPSLVLGRQRGERAEMIAGNPALPIQSAGAHDLPFSYMYDVANPNDASWSNGNAPSARIKWAAQRDGRVDGNAILIEDYLGKAPRISWNINAYQNYYTTKKIYSLRFYHRFNQGGWLNLNHHLVSFWLSGTQSFQIYHRGLHFNFPNPNEEGELHIAWPGGDIPADDTPYPQFTQLPGYGFYRYEIQVNENYNPKVRVRIYANDDTTPLQVLTANPTTVEMDTVTFGDFLTTGGLFSQCISDVEIWSDYLMNRQYPDNIANTVGTPYVPQKWSWTEYGGGSQYTPLDDIGTISSINPDGSNVVMTVPSDALTLEDTKSEIWTGASGIYTLHSNLIYGVGARRYLDLYVPNGPAPDDGWPVIVWSHGGFWVSGDKNTIPLEFVNTCILKGFAVASIQYVLGGMYFAGLGQSYPAWDPNGTTGRYPTFILNYKEATYWLQNTAAPIYNLNPNKFIASGHSAGGYNALGAVVTKGLTNDGAGRNLTLAGNVASFGCPSVTDPSYIGAYVFAAPINLNHLKSWDPTHPSWPYLNSGVGIINATARVFMGTRVDYPGGENVDNTNLDEFILLNAPNIPSIGYAWGRSDHLVISADFSSHSQKNLLQTAFDSASGSLPPDSTLTIHEIPDALHHTINKEDFDIDKFNRWIDQLPGL